MGIFIYFIDFMLVPSHDRALEQSIHRRCSQGRSFLHSSRSARPLV